MIWLIIFIISNYSLASSPPKVPGGVKRDIFSESRTLIHRAFSVNRKYQTRFQKSGICIFILCALSATRNCVFSCQKEKKGWLVWYDGIQFREVHGNNFASNLWRIRKTKVRKKVVNVSAFLGRRRWKVVKVFVIQTYFNCLILREAFCVVKFLKGVSD